MSIQTFPGVQVIEVPSGVRTITGVATSITAFIGRAQRGPLTATRVQSFAEYARTFGGLWADSPMSYAVQHFFQHGGRDAIIVRVFNGAATPANTATISLDTSTAANKLVLNASSPGSWGAALRAQVDNNTINSTDTKIFNLTIQLVDRSAGNRVLATEQLRNLSTLASSPRYYLTMIPQGSSFVTVGTPLSGTDVPTATAGTGKDATGGADGGAITDGDVIPTGTPLPKTGIYALDSVDLFNLLCIPPLSFTTEAAAATWGSAAQYCNQRRALLIVDPVASWTSNPSTAVATASTGHGTIRTQLGANAINAAVYFPRLRMADPLANGVLEDFAPSGAIAGIMARTDAQRGVWKAPAGLEAAFNGVSDFTYTLNDAENGVLNPFGLNCLRHFDVGGNVVWGARTAAGADALASEWKYLPVRRMALFLEESLYRGTQWVVFEPNDEPLWAQIRLNIGSFLHQLFRRGAFQGSKPSDAYFVKCDAETTTQADIDSGIVNIHVGFAPLKPAEFVILRIQQIAGELQT
jgi:Bacteriophage tail sheath protein